MFKVLTKKKWCGYTVGILLGLLIIATFLIAHRPLGASRAYITVAALLENSFIPDHVTGLAYFDKYKPEIGWTLVLVIGAMIGSFVSSILSNDFKLSTLPPMWKKRFGDRKGLRLGMALGGGILLGFASRLAGGCTSGQALSGILQLSVGGFVFFAAFFIGGIITSKMMYVRG